MAAHCKQIGQRTDHEEAMRVLLQTAIAHLGKAEHPLDDPDHMFNPGPHFGLRAVFRALDLIDNTAVAVAAIGEILGLWCVLPDHRSLAASRPDHPIPRVSLPFIPARPVIHSSQFRTEFAPDSPLE